MKLIRPSGSRRTLRRVAFAVVPLAAAGALLGPAAGIAQAAPALRPGPTSCLTLLNAADDSWDDGTYYDLAADSALARGAC